MSQKASGYERLSGDQYFTPAWPVEALLDVESFIDGPILDPCAGGWGIVDTLLAKKKNAIGFDIMPAPSDASNAMMSRDFLMWDGKGMGWRHIITNPPYGKQGKLAEKFIEHALELVTPRGGKVAMLLRVDFDSAHGRRRMFGDHPHFTKKYVLTKRIRWTNFEQSKSGPSENHAWYVWDAGMKDDLPFNRVGYGQLPR